MSTDALVLTLGAENGHALTSAQLKAAGVDRGRIERRIGRLLTPVSKGVFVVGPLTTTALTNAALLCVARGAVPRHGCP